MPGRWGKRVRHLVVDGRDERRRGDQPAGGGSLLKGRWGTTEKGGGVRQRGCHAARGRAWGLALTGGRHPDRVPADRGPAVTRPCFGSGVPTRRTRGPQLVVGEGVRSGARGASGPARRNAEWAKPRMNRSI
jgi:hypothetical protein